MSHITPRSSVRMPHTPRMSERKRALFPGAAAAAVAGSGRRRSAATSSASASPQSDADIAGLSALDTSDDESDGVHPWRRSARISDRKKCQESLKRSTKLTAKEIIQSPMAFSHHRRHPAHRRSCPETLAADADSCSSSLQDLTFGNDSDSSETFHNTRSMTRKSRKSLNNVFNRKQSKLLSPIKMKHSDKENFNFNSPSCILKTPNDGITIADESPPPRNHRRSIIVQGSSSNSPNPAMAVKRSANVSSPGGSRNKYPRIDNMTIPKARLSLFNNPQDNLKILVPVKSFYPKTLNVDLNASFMSESKFHPLSQSASRHNYKRRKPADKKKLFGQINQGVHHAIRRPKLSKHPTTLTKLDALNLALNIIENSPLNEYINEFMGTKTSTVKTELKNAPVKTVTNAEIANGTGISQSQLSKVDSILKGFGLESSLNTVLNHSSAPHFNESIINFGRETQYNNVSTKVEKDDSTLKNNKFFKSSRSDATVKLSNNVKLQMKDGKMSLPEKKNKELDPVVVHKQLSMIQSIVQFDTSDLLDNDDSDDEMVNEGKSTIDALLNQWDEEDVPESEPQFAKPSQTVVAQVHQTDLGNASSVMNSDSAFDSLTQSSQASGILSSIVPASWSSGSVSCVEMDQGCSSSSSEDYSVPTNSAGLQFMPVDGGYILVDDSEMMDDGALDNVDLERIESEIQELDKTINSMARLNNINPDNLLVSPINTQVLPVENINQESIDSNVAMCENPQTNDANMPIVRNLIDSKTGIAKESTRSFGNTNILANSNVSPMMKREIIESSPSSAYLNGTLTGASTANNSPSISSPFPGLKKEGRSPRKLFPLFNKDHRPNLSEESDRQRTPTRSGVKKWKSTGDDQYLIDAGQKSLGAKQCNECGVIYQPGDAEDENAHLIHHLGLDVLKFHGWKNEKLCGRWGSGRALVVSPGDPAAHWLRVRELLQRVVHPQLGLSTTLYPDRAYKVYLYVENKQIIGCLVAEPLKEAHKLLSSETLDCCSTETYPVLCGVSRIWTHKSYQRRGVATSLVNCMRANFCFGHVLAASEIAFSSPTPQGRAFAAGYTQDPNFMVYLN